MSSAPVLDFVVLYVSNLEEACNYFTQTLGLEHLADQDTPEFRGFAGGEKGLPFGIVQASERTPRVVQLKSTSRQTILQVCIPNSHSRESERPRLRTCPSAQSSLLMPPTAIS